MNKDQKRYCFNCGQPIKKGDLFCRNCNAELTEEYYFNPEADQINKKEMDLYSSVKGSAGLKSAVKMSKSVKMIIIAVILLLVAAVIIFLIKGNNASEVAPSEIQKIIQSEWDKSISEQSPEFLNKLNSRSSFTVIDQQDDGNGFYTVTANVTSPDISDAVKKLDEENGEKQLTGEEIDKTVSELIDKSKEKTTEQTVFVICDTENNYHVQFTEEFSDAMLGYILSESILLLSDNDLLVV